MDALGLAGLIVGLVALFVTLAIERLKRPRIKIIPSAWKNQAFVPWTFATVRIVNKPLIIPFRWLLDRQSAQGCRAEIEFYKWDSTAPFIKIPGRWSNSPQPLSLIPSSLATLPPTPGVSFYDLSAPPVTGAPFSPAHQSVTAGTAPTFSASGSSPGGPPAFSSPSGSKTAKGGDKFKWVYDPSRDPGQHEVTTDGEGEEIAVAILRKEEIFAFTTESYNYPDWGNPAWQLEIGSTYRVDIRVHGPGINKKRKFKIEYLSTNPSRFRLQEFKKGD